MCSMRFAGLIAGVVLWVLAAAPTAGASAWLLQPVPSPSGAIGAALTGVSCTGTRACTAIGDYDTRKSAATLGLAEHWDGSRWSITSAPRVPAGAAWASLSGLSCTSVRACIAVGNYERSGSFNLAEAWNGNAWSIQQALTPMSTDSALEAVSCSSRRSCLAVSEVVVERWNGTAWSYVAPLPLPSWADVLTVSGVSCTSPTRCTAVGQARWEGEDPSRQHVPWAAAWRWNGKRWSLTTFPGFAQLSAVSCTSQRACIAVGGAAAERWNGIRWFRLAVNGRAQLLSVSCTSARACTAVGRTSGGTLAARWNGDRWSIQRTPALRSGRSGHLDGVSCTSARSCSAVGGYTNRSGRELPLAERWTL
jgi:hypothetical protein